MNAVWLWLSKATAGSAAGLFRPTDSAAPQPCREDPCPYEDVTCRGGSLSSRRGGGFWGEGVGSQAELGAEGG